MRNMKKLLSLGLVSAMTMGLMAGCGGTSTSTGTNTETASSTETAASTLCGLLAFA